MPKQTDRDNGVICHQLHEMELVKILENASSYLPFLLEKDASGLTKAEQIVEMFRFRVPYYVGPLDSRSEHAWIVRSNDRIYPWNFDQVVDLEACRSRFITRMTAKCSYLGEDVLPKNSLIYTRYMVLDELNNLRINGKRISVETKQKIYNDLFLEGRKKVTEARLRTYLALDKEDTLSGFDTAFQASLAPWWQYQWLLDRPGGFEAAEEIIRQITLFGSERKLLQEWLAKTYGTLLTPEEQKRALAYRCSGWGRLSGAFLTGITHVDPDTGEARSILDMMWETNNNLMELMSGRYSFSRAVDNYRRQKADGQGLSLQEYLQDSYASPAIKRAIHQALRIVDEIVGIMKAPPKRIFVEMAREPGKKGSPTKPRKKELLDLYDKCKKDAQEMVEQLKLEPEDNLRRDKLYLYYTQLGKCMYSEEPIDLARLDSDYDIDHIYPQSRVKDDSLDNRVLVKKELNQSKGDKYPIAAEIRSARMAFWKLLRKRELISKEKYERLIQVDGSAPTGGFIARQLVETRQSSKIVAELLNRRFGDTTQIVYVKAINVSSFRQDQRLTDGGEQRMASQCGKEHSVQDPLFVKCREVNAMHHAKDAYLNIVVGNVFHVRFTQNPANYLARSEVHYNLKKLYDKPVRRGEDIAWVDGPTGSIATVRRMMQKNTALFTRLATEQKGGLFKQLPVSREEAQGSKKTYKAPLKSSDPRMTVERYGGYNKLTVAYFTLVEHKKGKKRVRALRPVQLLHKDWYERDPVGYCQQYLGLENPRIVIPRIKYGALLSYDGFRMHLSSRTENKIRLKNANQLLLAPVWHAYIKTASKLVAFCDKEKALSKQDPAVTQYGSVTAEQNQQLYELLLDKLEHPPYDRMLKTAADNLREGSAPFAALTVPDQCRILLQILIMFSNSAAGANLVPLGGVKNAGLVELSQNLETKKGHELYLIHQSITGFYEQKFDLLKGERT